VAWKPFHPESRLGRSQCNITSIAEDQELAASLLSVDTVIRKGDRTGLLLQVLREAKERHRQGPAREAQEKRRHLVDCLPYILLDRHDTPRNEPQRPVVKKPNSLYFRSTVT
jgi:hypothetical protein